jgi:signal transduction histidine kinase
VRYFLSILLFVFQPWGSYGQVRINPKDSLNSLISLSRTDSAKAKYLFELGQIFSNESNYENASSNFYKALEIYKKINHKIKIADCKKNIGVIKFYQKDLTGAEHLFNEAIDVYAANGLYVQCGNCYKNMGDVALLQKDTTKCKKNYEIALQYSTRTKDSIGLACIYSNLAIANWYQGNTNFTDLQKARDIWEKVSPYHTLSVMNLGNLGVHYLARVQNDPNKNTKALTPEQRSNLQKGQFYLDEAIRRFKVNKDIDNMAYFTGVLAELQGEKGDFENAYKNFHEFYDLSDSIYSQESKNKLAKIESQQEIDKKNSEIALQNLTISNQRKQKYYFIGGLLLLGIIGSLLYYQSRTRKKTNTTLMVLNNQLDEANKVKAKFFGILSHDLRSPVANLINFLQLQKRNPGILSEQQIAERENKLSGSAESLLETMEGMLLWSKGQMENFKPEATLVSADSLFEYIKNFFTDTANVSFRFSNPDDVMLQTDEHYLKTIMQNLTANAIKALQQTNEAAIQWKAWEEKGKLYLSITDNGPGITDEQAKSLFDEKNVTGTRHGLGLHIIRDLAKAIKCNISISKDNTAGTTFMLTI